MRSVDAALSKKKLGGGTTLDGKWDDGAQDDVNPSDQLRPYYQSSLAFGFDVELEFPRYQARLRKRFIDRRALILQLVADANAGLSAPELANVPRLPPPALPGTQSMNPLFDMFEGEKRCLHRVTRFFSYPNGFPDSLSKEASLRLPAGAAGVEVTRTGTVRFNQRFFVRAAISDAPLEFRARRRTRRNSGSDIISEHKEDAYFEVLITKVPKPRDERTRPVNISIGLCARPFPSFYHPGTAPLSFGVSITPGHKVRIMASVNPSPTSSSSSPTVIEVKLPKGKQPGAVVCKEGDTVGILLKKTERTTSEGRLQRGLKIYLLINGNTISFPLTSGSGSGVAAAATRGLGPRSGSFSGGTVFNASAAEIATVAAGRDPYDFLQAIGYQAASKFIAAVFAAPPSAASVADASPAVPGTSSASAAGAGSLESPVLETPFQFESPGLHAIVAAGGPCELLVDLGARVPPGVPGYDQMSPHLHQTHDDEFGLGLFGLPHATDDELLHVPGYGLPAFGSRPPSYRSQASHRDSEDIARRGIEGLSIHGGLVAPNGQAIPNTPPPDYHWAPRNV